MEHAAPMQSIVGLCDVTNCAFNEERQCRAGRIQVAFVEGMAHCATYTPQDGSLGIGSTDVSQHTGASVPYSSEQLDQ